jgi:hypothetical protein
MARTPDQKIANVMTYDEFQALWRKTAENICLRSKLAVS